VTSTTDGKQDKTAEIERRCVSGRHGDFPLDALKSRIIKKTRLQYEKEINVCNMQHQKYVLKCTKTFKTSGCKE